MTRAQRAAAVGILALMLGALALASGAAIGYVWKDKAEQADLSGDGKPETLVLKDRILTVTAADGAVVWQSERGWRVQDYVTGDMDADGLRELLVLVHKRGSYGSSRPFWVERDDPAYSQHIFIYRWNDEAGAPRPIWMASALPIRVQTFSLSPDGVVTLTTVSGEQSRWRWQTFGLVGLPPEPAKGALPP